MAARRVLILLVPLMLCVVLSVAHDGRVVVWGRERSFRGVQFEVARDAGGRLALVLPSDIQGRSAGSIQVHRTRTTRRVFLPLATTQLTTVQYAAADVALGTRVVGELLDTLEPEIVQHLGLHERLVSETPGVSYAQRATTVRWDSLAWLAAAACVSILAVGAFVRRCRRRREGTPAPLTGVTGPVGS